VNFRSCYRRKRKKVTTEDIEKEAPR